MINYKYIPNSYDYSLINEKQIDKEKFLRLQIKYKNDFEKLLLKIIDFKKIDEYINSFNLNIPYISNQENNFYYKYSILESKYLYLRNNIHIENLSNEDIEIIANALKNNLDLNLDFFNKTFKHVLYEKGDYSMFGIPMLRNKVSSKSIIFEFAYNQNGFKEVSQYNFVNSVIDVIYKSLSDSIKKVIDTEITIHSYNSIPDIYM